jgi:hypothetical protein
LLFRPGRIKLFKTNFHLTDKSYEDSYKKINSLTQDFFDDLATHDLFSILNFTRNLWVSNQIEVDEGCERVLKLSNEEYAKQVRSDASIPAYLVFKFDISR